MKSIPRGSISLCGPAAAKRWFRLIQLFILLFATGSAIAQTSQFTYQGRLVDLGNPANGQYDFEFKLFDMQNTGTQQGPTVVLQNIQVSDGIFSVQLDFGAAVLSGADRFLEISAKRPADPSFTTLTPRQPLTSVPYAVRSSSAAVADLASNASQLEGLAATGFVRNSTSQQPGTNFNIGGTGTANVLEATTQFNLGGSRFLSSAGTDNVFVGVG